VPCPRSQVSRGYSCAPFHFVVGFNVLACCSDIENWAMLVCCAGLLASVVSQMLRSINFLGASLPQQLRVLRRFTCLIPIPFEMVGETRYLKSL
jgi:hypothetical protein